MTYTENNNRLSIAIWLFICCAMVAVMVVVGGVTRLTNSGLSIVNWHPIHGVIPPISEVEWQEEFDQYKQSPEYQKINKGMSIEEFKGIFALEYIHRLIGRIVGFVFLLPFLYFLVRKQLNLRLSLKLGGIFLLGGLQGVIGWYMVKSGLIDDPQVSPYRLALHLSTAFLIYGLLFWTALSLIHQRKNTPVSVGYHPKLAYFSYAVTTIICLQVIIGAFVAGLDAGLTYNTFPLMDGKWIPSGLWLLEPTSRNLTENITTVQFLHRVVGVLTLVTIIGYWVRTTFLLDKHTIAKPLKISTHLLLFMAGIQVVLGILTLVWVVPVTLASLHQLGALILFTIALFINHSVLYIPARTTGL